MSHLIEGHPQIALRMFMHLLSVDAIRLRRTNEKLREFVLKAELTRQEIERLKSEIVTLVSQEFRTPVSVIQGSVEMLEKNAVGEEHRRKVIQLITRQTSQLTRLLEDVSYLSSLSETGMTFNPDQFAAEELLDEIRAEHEGWLDQLKLDLEARWGQERTLLTGDRQKIKKAIGHLVNNAIKYNRRHGKVIVQLTLVAGPAAEIRIQDTGVGIPPEGMDKIYEAFKRPTLERHHGGLGIGLPLARSIVQGHGGTMTIDSEKGKGTTVTILIPLEPTGLKGKVLTPLLQRGP
jgi:signal transduction histidine kinase